MSTNIKRKLELSRAMTIANNTSHLKRKTELSNALAATNDMIDEPPENSLPNSFVSSRKKRVTFPPRKTFSNSSISSSLAQQTIMDDSTRDTARMPREEPQVQHMRREEPQVQHMPNTLNARIRTDVRESSKEIADKTSDDTNRFLIEKRSRGLTRGLNTQKYMRKCGEKPKIVIPKGINKPVGEHSSKHATEIGVLIRLEAPMQVDGWAKIPNDKKEDLFRKLVNKLSYEVEEPHVVHCIWKSFAKQYSTFRSNAHKYYLRRKAEGGVALARQSIYEKLANHCDDWLWLCDFWETEKFQKISQTQSKNRAKLKHKHKLGTKSRAAHQYENNLDDIDMYEVEFYNAKNGWADKEVEANYVRMKELREEQQTLPNDDARLSSEQICISVLGEDSSYAKSKGLNPKKSAYFTYTSEASINRARLEEDLATTQAELESTKAELALQKTTVEAVVKCVEKMIGKNFAEIINSSDGGDFDLNNFEMPTTSY